MQRKQRRISGEKHTQAEYGVLAAVHLATFVFQLPIDRMNSHVKMLPQNQSYSAIALPTTSFHQQKRLQGDGSHLGNEDENIQNLRLTLCNDHSMIEWILQMRATTHEYVTKTNKTKRKYRKNFKKRASLSYQKKISLRGLQRE